MVEDTLKAEVERRKENVGKRVTKVIFQSHPFTFFFGWPMRAVLLLPLFADYWEISLFKQNFPPLD